MVPELKGSPKLFTIKTSDCPKNPIVSGSSNLNMKSNTDITIILATMKLVIVIVL